MRTFCYSDGAVVCPSIGCWIISSLTALGYVYLGSPGSRRNRESLDNIFYKIESGYNWYLLVCLLVCDGVESLDILVFVDGGDEGDDVPLYGVLCSPTEQCGTCSLFL